MKKLIKKSNRATRLGTIALAISMFYNAESANAQSECYTKPGYTGGPVGATTITLPCTPSTSPTTDFNSFYVHKENYLPVDGVVAPLYVHKTIKVLIHVICPTIPVTPKVNFEDNPTDRAKIEAIVAKMNTWLSNVPMPSSPKSAVCGSCHITDSRFKIEMVKQAADPTKNDIRYHYSTLKFEDVFLYGSVGFGVYSGDLNPFFENTEGMLNVFLMYTGSSTGPLGGVSMGPYEDVNDIISGNNNGVPFIVTENYFRNGNIDLLANNLLHEIGHTMTTHHTFGSETCTETDLDYLSDAYGSTATGTKNCPLTSGLQDVFMNYNVYGNYLTPLQIARWHRNAHFMSCRKYIYNTYPEDKYHDNTGQGQKNPYLITKNETWDFDIKMYNDIIVKAGNKLTIKCRVLMPYHANIIVEPGAELEVDGGIIDSHHDTTMWYGINVWGNKNQPQTATFQGVVTLKNGATIKNALHAVTLYDDVFKDDNKTGGIAYIQDAHFINNRHSIGWGEYHNLNWEFKSGVWTKTRLQGNVSVVNRCTFEINNAMIRDPFAQISIFNVDGISIRGCSFTNTMSFTPSGVRCATGCGWHNAISASGSTFTVSDWVPISGGTTVPSKIKGFLHGVLVQNFGINGGFTIKNSAIDNNQIGILTSAVNGYKIKNNSFNLSNPITTGAQALGVQVRGGSLFNVYNNTFTTPSSFEKMHTGVEVVQCGSDNNLINNNTFSYLRAGSLSTGQNTNLVYDPLDEIKSKGLEFKCNSYIGNDIQEFLNGYNDATDGVRRVQGEAAKPVGNTFAAPSYWQVYVRDLGTPSGYSTMPVDKYYFSTLFSNQNPIRHTPIVTTVGIGNSNPCLVIEPTSAGDGSSTTDPYSTSDMAAARLRLIEAYNDFSADRVSILNNALVAMHSPYAETERALLQMQYGNVAQGLAIYNNIANTMPLTTQEQQEFALGGTIMRLVAEHYNSAASNWHSLSNTQLDSLRYVRNNAKMWAHERACNWLSYAIGENCAIQMPNTAIIDTSGGNARKALLGEVEQSDYFAINPNPSKLNFELSYQLADDKNPAVLLITDIVGKQVAQINLAADKNRYSLNANEWQTGVYLYRLVQSGKTLYNGKLIKQ